MADDGDYAFTNENCNEYEEDVQMEDSAWMKSCVEKSQSQSVKQYNRKRSGSTHRGKDMTGTKKKAGEVSHVWEDKKGSNQERKGSSNLLTSIPKTTAVNEATKRTTRPITQFVKTDSGPLVKYTTFMAIIEDAVAEGTPVRRPRPAPSSSLPMEPPQSSIKVTHNP